MQSIDEIANSFRIRCSSISKIMVGASGLTDKQAAKVNAYESRVKPMTELMKEEYDTLIHKRDNPILSAGAKTYCKEWLKNYLYGRKTKVTTESTDKGNKTEEEGVTLLSMHYGKMFTTDTKRIYTEYIEGVCDVLDLPVVYDIKSSIGLHTFPMFETKPPKKDYTDQLQGYMIIYKADKAELVYTLNNSPIELIESEIKSAEYRKKKFEGVDAEMELYEYHYILEQHIFTEEFYIKVCRELNIPPNDDFIPIPDKDRIKIFHIAKDPTAEAKIIKQVKLCREYIKELLKGK